MTNSNNFVSNTKGNFQIFPDENFVDLTLFQYGREACRPGQLFGPARRSHYLFHYILSGTGTLDHTSADGRSLHFNVRSGQGFLICPGEVNTYIADTEHPWEYMWVEFDGIRAVECLRLAGLSSDEPIYRDHSKALRQEMAAQMELLVSKNERSALATLGHFYLFMDLLIRSAAGYQPPQRDNSLRSFYVHEGIVFIEQNFQNDISIEEIAAHCGVNRSYFGKIFKQSVGKSPQEFLIYYRMTRAAELLKLTSLSIADVGKATGYPDQMHFSRAFRRYYGLSPSQWRSANRIPGRDVKGQETNET